MEAKDRRLRASMERIADTRVHLQCQRHPGPAPARQRRLIDEGPPTRHRSGTQPQARRRPLVEVVALELRRSLWPFPEISPMGSLDDQRPYPRDQEDLRPNKTPPCPPMRRERPQNRCPPRERGHHHRAQQRRAPPEVQRLGQTTSCSGMGGSRPGRVTNANKPIPTMRSTRATLPRYDFFRNGDI